MTMLKNKLVLIGSVGLVCVFGTVLYNFTSGNTSDSTELVDYNLHVRPILSDKCFACHGPDAKGGPVYGTMVGGIGSMTQSPRILTPGSMYPYAAILFDYTRRAMPMNAPQSLTNDEVYAVTAYIYNLNGLVPADAVVDSKYLAAMKMPNRDAFITDTRPDVKAERCMSNCKPINTKL